MQVLWSRIVLVSCRCRCFGIKHVKNKVRLRTYIHSHASNLQYKMIPALWAYGEKRLIIYKNMHEPVGWLVFWVHDRLSLLLHFTWSVLLFLRLEQSAIVNPAFFFRFRYHWQNHGCLRISDLYRLLCVTHSENALLYHINGAHYNKTTIFAWFRALQSALAIPLEIRVRVHRFCCDRLYVLEICFCLFKGLI